MDDVSRFFTTSPMSELIESMSTINSIALTSADSRTYVVIVSLRELLSWESLPVLSIVNVLMVPEV